MWKHAQVGMAWHRDTLLRFVCASIESSTITIVLMVGRHISSFLPVALPEHPWCFWAGSNVIDVISCCCYIFPYSLCRPIRSQVQLVRSEQLDQDSRPAVTSSQTSIDGSCTSVEQLYAIYLFKKTHQTSWRDGCQVFVLADTFGKLLQKKWKDRFFFSLSLCGVHWQVSVNVKAKQRNPELKQLQSALYPKPSPKRRHVINNVWLEDSKLAACLKFFFFMFSLFSVAPTTLNGCCFSCQPFCARWIIYLFFLNMSSLPEQLSSAQTRPSAVSEAHSDISLRLPGI